MREPVHAPSPVRPAEPERPDPADFDLVHARFRSACKDFDWRATFPDAGLPPEGNLRPLEDLMTIDVSVVISKMITDDVDRKLYGYLPYMALGSAAGIGKLLASSFAERVNSQGNIVLDKGNTLLSDEEVEMLVVLRMNRQFMTWIRSNFPKLTRDDLKAAVVTAEMNREPADDEEDVAAEAAVRRAADE